MSNSQSTKSYWDVPHSEGPELEAFDYAKDGYEEEYEQELVSRNSYKAIKTEAGPPPVQIKTPSKFCRNSILFFYQI